MKRSQINRIIEDSIAFLAKHGFHLPPFAYFSPADWAEKGHEYDEIRDNMLGWDVTDYGLGDFEHIGLTLFTIRNGSLTDPAYPKPYAEKILISLPGQVTPEHFHWHKTEDIICRAGADLVMRLTSSDENEEYSDAPVTVSIDGRRVTVPSKTVITLHPGESITLPTGLYHSFWAPEGGEASLIGEVSMVNDDNTDNRFYEKQGRFPKIEEDEPARWLLCSEYPAAK
ncbi:MAG: D-lyxose/D-mannose family sugar isomerase [Oscillospiraceae bacterium]|nr:D-lyxose/D-mannose family sugar isomerase [Oscillospiraceae bacterium]